MQEDNTYMAKIIKIEKGKIKPEDSSGREFEGYRVHFKSSFAGKEWPKDYCIETLTTLPKLKEQLELAKEGDTVLLIKRDRVGQFKVLKEEVAEKMEKISLTKEDKRSLEIRAAQCWNLAEAELLECTEGILDLNKVKERAELRFIKLNDFIKETLKNV